MFDLFISLPLMVGWAIEFLYTPKLPGKKRSASVVDLLLLLIPNATDASATLLLARRP